MNGNHKNSVAVYHSMTFLYERLLRPIFFLQDPEKIHDRFVRLGFIMSHLPPAKWALATFYRYKSPKLRQRVAGMMFDNPVGLAAGFDKDCKLMTLLPSVGFGFEEVGSITAEPYEGNKGPRVTRLKADKGIIVNYGLKNEGATLLRKRLLKKKFSFPVGVSIAKTNKHFKTEKAKVEDWLTGLRLMKGTGDYLTINLSCPNTSDPANYCTPKKLRQLLLAIKRSKMKFSQPVFLKLSHDLSLKDATALIKLCVPYKWITGFIVSNLGKERRKLNLQSDPMLYEGKKGGISGPVTKKKALELVRHFSTKGNGRFVIIGCGGIFSAEDAYEYIRAGASLVQLVTGMIYRGPGLMKEINKGLVTLLEEDGFKNISEAIGAAHRFN
jgi:dihydroorotate dehydrogenase